MCLRTVEDKPFRGLGAGFSDTSRLTLEWNCSGSGDHPQSARGCDDAAAPCKVMGVVKTIGRRAAAIALALFALGHALEARAVTRLPVPGRCATARSRCGRERSSARRDGRALRRVAKSVRRHGHLQRRRHAVGLCPGAGRRARAYHAAGELYALPRGRRRSHLQHMDQALLSLERDAPLPDLPSR